MAIVSVGCSTAAPLPQAPPANFTVPLCETRPAEFAPVKAERFVGENKEAKVLKDFKGPYPRKLAEDGVEGNAVLLVEVTRTGAIRCIRLAKTSANQTLDALAVEYVSKFTFSPAVVDGAAVDSILRYTYRFEIYDDDPRRLHEDDVFPIVKAQEARIAECGRLHGETGVVVMSWQIEKGGSVSKISIADARPTTAATECVADVIRSLKFPESGMPMFVSFPLTLGP